MRMPRTSSMTKLGAAGGEVLRISSGLWTAPVLWRFEIVGCARKRQRTAAVQDAGAWAQAAFHHSRIEHLGDVGMIHDGQRLPLRLEPGDDLLGVHARLDDLQRHAPPHRLGLLGRIHHTAPAFAHALQKFVAPERLADGLIGRVSEVELDGRACRFGLGGQQRLGLLVRGKQGVEPLKQRDVSARGRLQKAGAGRAGQSRRS